MVMDRALDDIVKENRNKRRQNNLKNKSRSPMKKGPNNNNRNNNGRKNSPMKNNRNQMNNNNRNNNRNTRNMGGNNRGPGPRRNNNYNNQINNRRPNNMIRGRNNNQNNRGPMRNNNNNQMRRPNNNNLRNNQRRGLNNRRNPIPNNRNLMNRNRNVQKNRPGLNRNLPIRKNLANLNRNPIRKPVNNPCTLHVSNLHFKVSEKDMKELFGEFGKLNKVAMHYDKNGKPQGTCDIHFAQKTDAVRALRKYNKVPLDGRPMEIKIVEDLAAKPRIVKPQPVANRIRNAVRPLPNRNIKPAMQNKRQQMMQKVRKSITRANQLKNRKIVKKAPQNNKNKSPAKKTTSDKKLTEEDLDKQLDAYLSAGAM